ncbi:MAG: hypothetical protein V4615_05650 [Bacteroidota bacterium]
MNKKLKNHLIDKYRESISERYDYDKIKTDPNLPKGFTKDNIDELRQFFLENLYSSPAEREKLDAAFIQLETFIAHPSKIWGLLGSLPTAIFEFGLHFPAAVKAAASALHTHTSARHFEDALLQAAEGTKYPVPLTDEQFRECLAALPSKQLMGFLDDLASLFQTITDTALLKKTIHIMENILKRMDEKKDVYGPEDKDAIMLGVNLFKKSYKLLERYDDDIKNQVVQFVVYNETKFIKGLHKKRKSAAK